MIKSQYKREMENIVPHSGFEEDTVAFLIQAVGPQNREEKTVIKKRSAVLIAVIAAVFLMTSTVFAAVAFLRPDEVADTFGETAVAEAFRSEDAVVINRSIRSNGYNFTLMGIVSGEGLEGIRADGEERSYLVLSIEQTDGTPFAPEDECPVTITPLINGFEPWRMSIYSLDAYRMDTTAEGIRYCLISTDSLEIFADRGVCIAVFDGIAPSTSVFAMNEDGVVGYSDSYNGTKAMFDLPLDTAKADPAAAAELVAKWEAECAGEDSTTASDDDFAFSEDASGATTAASIENSVDEIIFVNENVERYSLACEVDGTLHIYDSEGNELPAENFEGITKWGTVIGENG